MILLECIVTRSESTPELLIVPTVSQNDSAGEANEMKHVKAH